MELAADVPAANTAHMLKKHRFRSMKLLNFDLDDALENGPSGADYGRLDNGLTYYVCCNSKPRMRAALSLVVNVGSVLEEEGERGVAHIVEHLGFSATKNFSNHEIVKFLESVGAEFGPCQNAVTTADETIYEMLVPVDKPEILSQAISILAEFSTEIRVSKDDLKKERGAVMEEYRGRRNASGRMQEAIWASMMEGSKYEDRLPIGTEKVIRTVSHETVKQFYSKWYHLGNMAVIAVGDFPDTQTVVELVKSHFGQKSVNGMPPIIPAVSIPSNREPKFSCSVDSEAGGSDVMVAYKTQASKMKTVNDYKKSLTETMFLLALNQRFSKLSKRKDPPYFSCSVDADLIVRPLKVYFMAASCKEGGTAEALESMLEEVARVRLHEFTEREIARVRALILSATESAYLERDQRQSTELRSEFVKHFLQDEAVIGTEREAQLTRTLLPCISVADVSEFAEKFQTSNSCVIKTIEPSTTVSVDRLKAVISRVSFLEEAGLILPWEEEPIPEKIVSVMPNIGNIEQELEYPTFEATELVLTNGMRVCYKCTDFQTDQVIFSGFSYGGLSQVPEQELFSYSMGSLIASETGIFGYRPSALTDMLAGKIADVDTDISEYMRTFYGFCSPSDLETALQLVYQLFITNITPSEDDVNKIMQMTEEAIRGQDRDPRTAFSNRVMEINYGDSYYYRPPKLADLGTVNPRNACHFFSNCFKDPSTFTVIIVGNLDPETARPLIMQYLGGIPKPPRSILHYDRDNLKALQFSFPANVVRDVVQSAMTEEQCDVKLCFPVKLSVGTLIEDAYLVALSSKLIEMRMLQVLRFKHGKIYSASASPFLGGSKPFGNVDILGDISIDFSCDPDFSTTLADLALEELMRLQEDGPSLNDVNSILEIEQRDRETALQENHYWLGKLQQGYQSRMYTGDIDATYQILEEGRNKVLQSLTPETIKSALQRIIPCPCKKQYTLIILMPRKSSLRRLLKSMFHYRRIWRHGDSKIFSGVADASEAAHSLWKDFRAARKAQK